MPRRFFKGEANLTDVKTQMEPAWLNVTARGSWDNDERGEKTSLRHLDSSREAVPTRELLGGLGKGRLGGRLPCVLLRCVNSGPHVLKRFWSLLSCLKYKNTARKDHILRSQQVIFLVGKRQRDRQTLCAQVPGAMWMMTSSSPVASKEERSREGVHPGKVLSQGVDESKTARVALKYRDIRWGSLLLYARHC